MCLIMREVNNVNLLTIILIVLSSLNCHFVTLVTLVTSILQSYRLQIYYFCFDFVASLTTSTMLSTGSGSSGVLLLTPKEHSFRPKGGMCSWGVLPFISEPSPNLASSFSPFCFQSSNSQYTSSNYPSNTAPQPQRSS